MRVSGTSGSGYGYVHDCHDKLFGGASFALSDVSKNETAFRAGRALLQQLERDAGSHDVLAFDHTSNWRIIGGIYRLIWKSVL